MENEKRKLVIIGYSHAKRLHNSCKQNENLRKLFDIQAVTFAGKTWPQVKGKITEVLNKPFNSKDILLFQIFGNDLLKKGVHVKDFKTGIIHLRKFSPVEDSDLLKIYNQFQQILAQTSATVILIDNPCRHLQCCAVHKEEQTELASYFRKRNREFAEKFVLYSVLDHRKLIPSISLRKLKHVRFYMELMDNDTVHLKPEFYDEWAASLARLLQF